MYKDIYPEDFKDIVLMLQIPFEEIWFVQHMIEAVDGLGLVTSNPSNLVPGCVEVLTNSSQIDDLKDLLKTLSQHVGNVEIINVQSA